MLTLIFICLLLCLIGYVLNKEIVFLEFLANCFISILCAVIIYGICIIPFPNDFYYQSGKFVQVTYHPYFVEEYEDCWECCTEDDDGHETCTEHCSTEHAKHPEYWTVKDSLGQEETISYEFYTQIKHKFGDRIKRFYEGRTTRCTHGGHRIKGDNALYYVDNETNTYEYPTTAYGRWFNPIKRTHSIFNTEKNIVEYPHRHDWLNNDRGLGKEWDILNTQLFERIGVNVVLSTSQEDLKNIWMRGKQNDIIIQVDNIKTPTKVKVFGWFGSERLVSELETYILDNGIKIDGIKHVILSYYVPFDFSEFKYLKFQVADWQIILISIITLIVMCITYFQFSINDWRR